MSRIFAAAVAVAAGIASCRRAGATGLPRRICQGRSRPPNGKASWWSIPPPTAPRPASCCGISRSSIRGCGSTTVELNSGELYKPVPRRDRRRRRHCRPLWASAMDGQVKLAAEGKAATYASPELPVAAEMGGVAKPGLWHDLRADHLRLQQAAGAGRRRAAGPCRAAELLEGKPAPTRAGSPPTIRKSPAPAICSPTRTSRISRRPGTCSRLSARARSGCAPRPPT